MQRDVDGAACIPRYKPKANAATAVCTYNTVFRDTYSLWLWSAGHFASTNLLYAPSRARQHSTTNPAPSLSSHPQGVHDLLRGA